MQSEPKSAQYATYSVLPAEQGPPENPFGRFTRNDADELVGVVVQAEALELLVRRVATGLLQGLQHRGQVDADLLRDLGRRDQLCLRHIRRGRRQQVLDGEPVRRHSLVLLERLVEAGQSVRDSGVNGPGSGIGGNTFGIA